MADILFDLKRRETRTYAHIFSRGLVDNLRAAAKLNHNPERSAGFVVLKAPEFPSVLVELGYLSNPQDVQSLASPEWRAKAAAAMVKAIDAFFAGERKARQRPSRKRRRRHQLRRPAARHAGALRLARSWRAGVMACGPRRLDHRFAVLEPDRGEAGVFDFGSDRGGVRNVGRSGLVELRALALKVRFVSTLRRSPTGAMEGFDREMRGIARIIGFIFATGALLFVVAAAVFAGVIWKYEQDLPDYSLLKNYEPPVMTRVHAADGSLLAEYSRERRLYLPSDEIPDLVKHAFISAEDKNFYSHWGVDPEGIVRAGMVYIQGSRHIQGASTITQQVAKNFLLNSDRTFDRKIREILLSLANRVRVFEGEDSRALPQRDLSRPFQLRHRRRGAQLFQ